MNLLDNQELWEYSQAFLNLESAKQSELQNIVELASLPCEKPVALITLLGKEMDWICAAVGFEAKQVSKETSFCHHLV